MNEHVNRDYNITRGESEPGSGRFHSPINIVEDDYCDEIVPKLAAVGNVAVTTTSERLFLRQPLVAELSNADVRGHTHKSGGSEVRVERKRVADALGPH